MTPPNRPKLRVLIIDDEQGNRDLIKQRLATMTSWVTESSLVPDARSAFAALRESIFDVAFVDHRLPDDDGLRVLEQIRQQYPKMAVVVMSALGSEKIAVQAMRRGAIDYIVTQELESSDLAQLLRRAVEMQLLQGENAELRQVNRMKDEFISSVSHELRTPLAVILGYAKTMEDGELGELSPQQSLAIRAIRSRGERLLEMLNRLLTFKESKLGTQEVLLRPTDLTSFFKEFLSADFADAKKKNVALETDLPDGPLWSLADPDQLKEVVNGLLSNAIKFSPDGSKVLISMKIHPPQEVWLRFEDQGRGIPSESLPRIFDAFFHTDSDLTREISGLGIGLALARQIVEMHGGRIWLESEGQAKGTTATVALPLVQPDTPHMVVEQQRRIDKKRVLIVEDNADIVEIIRIFLAGVSKNIVLTTTDRGQDALDLMSQRRFDLLLLDLFLPGLSGFDVLERMKRLPEERRLPVVILTGHRQAAQQAMRKGAAGVILKPFNKRNFIDTVLKMLGLERRTKPRS